MKTQFLHFAASRARPSTGGAEATTGIGLGNASVGSFFSPQSELSADVAVGGAEEKIYNEGLPKESTMLTMVVTF